MTALYDDIIERIYREQDESAPPDTEIPTPHIPRQALPHPVHPARVTTAARG
jgi:hypothetical protein